MKFDNRFIRELPGDTVSGNAVREVKAACWSAVTTTPVSHPQWVAWSQPLADELGLGADALRDPALLAALAGNGLLPGMQTYATCYGGHQFGHWAGQLGDGRAIYLGEMLTPGGERREWQLKGAGPTPYSRRADGRAVLRSSIREFLCSEAMFHLGVPTTRALSLVTTGDRVMRDMFYDGNPRAEPGAIVCRVAPSFTRFGHFEIHASRGDTDVLRQLVEFTIRRDFPAIDPLAEDRVAQWFSDVCRRTARLMVEWLRVGFVHGVMNTDNMSILGLTIDYGPYGWVDNFDPGWTPNTTDAEGRRYCFGRQPMIARWNLERLGEAISALLPDETALDDGIAAFDQTYDAAANRMLADKFGLLDVEASDGELMTRAFALLQAAEVDMTLFFRGLSQVDASNPQANDLQHAWYLESEWQGQRAALQQWLTAWGQRVGRQNEPNEQRAVRMNRVNPCYVLRNYLAQQAIEKAEQGDFSEVHQLLKLIEKPYDPQPGMEAYAARRPDWARRKAGASMLSCSS